MIRSSGFAAAAAGDRRLGACRFYYRGAWRTRNTMLERFYRHSCSKDAQSALVLLTSLRGDAERLDATSRERLPRLLKEDLLSMLHTLLEKGQMEVASKVFYHIHREDWYRPERKFYDVLVRSFARGSNFSALEKILDEMELRGCKLKRLMSIELMEACVAAGQQPLAFKIFAALKSDPSVPRAKVYWKLIDSLNRAGEFEASLKLEEELHDSAGKKKRRDHSAKEVHALEPWAS
ncbi:pentatricopeptide repeat-containing protein At1g52640, mitochondrial-like [Selaginella moellendorffii]|uniref:pentatricopeptide repeat-containing protein At1g52640, mitochondrial-like n=1 Tax=Selaginella moellendorffii TaxID=88036 RepID=UPI000D1CFC96|nr:pentatricopeptide repeat-containing protein At1g52640, mitochondrial-like [Selaginella moellendorffii]|eukprot:XP_024529496.1 pentatricopeptide repeat-containing protein At1g52640, mitochondrial-like [Selaginella moellendorffii]